MHSLREKKERLTLLSQYCALCTPLEQSVAGLEAVISSEQVATLTQVRIEELLAEVQRDKERVSAQYALAEQLPHASAEMGLLTEHTRDLNRRLVNCEDELHNLHAAVHGAASLPKVAGAAAADGGGSGSGGVPSPTPLLFKSDSIEDDLATVDSLDRNSNSHSPVVASPRALLGVVDESLEDLDAADADVDRVPDTLPLSVHRTSRLFHETPDSSSSAGAAVHRRSSARRSSARDSLSSTPFMSSRPSSIAPNDGLAAQLVGEMCALHDALVKCTAEVGSLAPHSHEPTPLHSQLEQLRTLEQELDTKRALAQNLDMEYKKLASDQLVSRKALEEVKKANHSLKQAVKALSSAIHQANASLTQTLDAAAEFAELQQATSSSMDTIAADLPSLALLNGGPEAASALSKVDALRDDLQSQGDALHTMRKLSRTLEAQLSSNATLSVDERAAPSRAVEVLQARAATLDTQLRSEAQRLGGIQATLENYSTGVRTGRNELDELNNALVALGPLSCRPERIAAQLEQRRLLHSSLEQLASRLLAMRAEMLEQNVAQPELSALAAECEALENSARPLHTSNREEMQRAQDTLPAAEIFWEQLKNLQTSTERMKEALERDEGLALLMPTEACLLTGLREELDTLREDSEALLADLEACENNGKRLQEALDDQAERQQITSQMESARARLEQSNRLLEARTHLFDEQTSGLDTFSARLAALRDLIESKRAEFERRFGTESVAEGSLEELRARLERVKEFKGELEAQDQELLALTALEERLKAQSMPESREAIEQSAALVRNNWAALVGRIVERKHQLQNALVGRGDFEHTFEELTEWMNATERELTATLVDRCLGDTAQLELLEHKLKVPYESSTLAVSE